MDKDRLLCLPSSLEERSVYYVVEISGFLLSRVDELNGYFASLNRAYLLRSEVVRRGGELFASPSH